MMLCSIHTHVYTYTHAYIKPVGYEIKMRHLRRSRNPKPLLGTGCFFCAGAPVCEVMSVGRKEGVRNKKACKGTWASLDTLEAMTSHHNKNNRLPTLRKRSGLSCGQKCQVQPRPCSGGCKMPVYRPKKTGPFAGDLTHVHTAFWPTAITACAGRGLARTTHYPIQPNQTS